MIKQNLNNKNTKKLNIAIVFGFLCDFFYFSNALSHHCTVAWVTGPECPKGVKDVIKQARRAATATRGAPRLLVANINPPRLHISS